MTKITAIIIMIVAALAAIFCLLFKIKINPSLSDRKSLKSKFFVALSIMMAFFAGFFTSCKTQEQAIAGTTTPTELSVSEKTVTPETVSTPSVSPGDERTPPAPTCYVVVPPVYTPPVNPNTILPTCYTVVPQITPAKRTEDKDVPFVTCYKPAVLHTPTAIPSQTPLGTPSFRTCYVPMPEPTSYKNDSSIIDSKLALIEEISKKNTVKEEILNRVKKNMLNQRFDV
ncbi:MAG: hypothetical protein ABRQ39_26590 [Candidatus Eremiobacterota bacterium]